MSHVFYIAMSYGITALICLSLVAWVVLDGRARQRELKQLEAAGHGRRSARNETKS